MYLPFLDGKYSVAPGLQRLKKVENDFDKLVFQIDSGYPGYLNNKESCRREDLHKYYSTQDLRSHTVADANRFIVQQLLHEYAEQFKLLHQDGRYVLQNSLKREQLVWYEDWIQVENKNFVSLFDALAMQVQEDFAICQLEGDKDWIAALHVCSPNHWAPSDKAGRPFDTIHAIVPGMEKTMPHYFKMLTSAVTKGPFTRFAWGISTDDRLNHHPVAPKGADPVVWQGRRIEEGCDLYLRVEKQTLNGLQQENAFFFTIRTYFYPVNNLSQTEKAALVTAIESMSEQSLLYKGLAGKVPLLRKMLS